MAYGARERGGRSGGRRSKSSVVSWRCADRLSTNLYCFQDVATHLPQQVEMPPCACLLAHMRLDGYIRSMPMIAQPISMPQHEVRGLAAAYKAVGDETRLRMLSLLLAADELCVCKFEELLGISQSKSSRHLRYLSNAGLVEGRREGIWVHYRIGDDLSPALRAVTESVRLAVEESGVQAEVEKIEEIDQIMSYGVMLTPALVIDGNVMSTGKIPDSSQIVTWLTTAVS